MLFGGGAIWAIDIGQSSLKAVKAAKRKGGIVVEAAVMVDYPQLVEAGGPDREEIIAQAVDKFVDESGIRRGERVALAIPSVGAIVRYINLPPVQRSRIPEIVRYEARQQIPFPLEESIWDYELVEREYEPGEELEVGLFAVRRENVYNVLYHFDQRGFRVELIQLAPIAVYNFVRLAGLVDSVGMILSVGAACTDLIIADNKSLLVRSIPVAGNDMTRTLQEKLRVSFIQAENLKRRSASVAPEQAKRMLGVMLPVLQTFVAEVQRTLGYYRAQVRGIKVDRIVALGNGVRVRGMRQYLARQLEIPVEPVMNLTEAIKVADGSVSDVLNKNVPAFGAALGLAAQALGQADNKINLTPLDILRRHVLAGKRPFAAGVATCGLIALLVMWASASRNIRLLKGTMDEASGLLQTIEAADARVSEYKNISPYRDKLEKIRSIAAQQMQWIDLTTTLGEQLPPDLAISNIQAKLVKLGPVKDSIKKNSGGSPDIAAWIDSHGDDTEIVYIAATGRVRYPPGGGSFETYPRVDAIVGALRQKRAFAAFEIPESDIKANDPANSLDLNVIKWFIIPPG